MSDWRSDLAGVWRRAWDLLQSPPPRTDAPRGLATLATTGVDGHPEARQVVIRAADQKRAHLDVYTDGATPKISELSTTPLATLLVWHGGDQLQIRMRCEVEFLSGAAVSAIWEGMEAETRGNFGVMPVPGTVIAAPDAYVRTPDRNRLMVLRASLMHMDVVHLGSPHHLRALYTRNNGWQGQWLAP